MTLQAVPTTLSLPETEDATKYAQLARLAYEKDPAQVLAELKSFETLPGIKPFAGLEPSDVGLINYHTTLFDTKLLPGSLKTDTEVLFIRVPGKGFDRDTLEAPGDQLIVAFRGTETNVNDGFGSDLLTDIRAVRSSIRDMKGLPAGTLDGPEYDDMMVHRGFLASFNDLMTGGDSQQPTMEQAAQQLMGGRPPARVVCCGHSLGAALATLGAFWWSRRHPEVEIFNYAFASPRVGNTAFSNDFLAGTGDGKQQNAVAFNQVDKSYRFTHKGDLVPTVPPPGWPLGYTHVERSVFLIEPKENGWGVEGSGDVPLAPGQTYAALLTDRPLNYLMTRVLNPISSTRVNYHSMDQMLAGLQNILAQSTAAVSASLVSSV